MQREEIFMHSLLNNIMCTSELKVIVHAIAMNTDYYGAYTHLIRYSFFSRVIFFANYILIFVHNI